MVDLSKDSNIQQLAKEIPDKRTYHILVVDSNQKRLADNNVHSVGDLITPDGERAFSLLPGTGRKSRHALYSFLWEMGFSPDWPYTQAALADPGSQICRNLNLTGALDEADKQHAMKTAEPVGSFQKRIQENTEAQEKGARLKGRRTL